MFKVSGEISNELADNVSETFGSDAVETGAVTREVEEGVSSSGATDQQGRAGLLSAAQTARTPIVWDANPAQPASTSPQRPIARSIVSFLSSFSSFSVRNPD